MSAPQEQAAPDAGTAFAAGIATEKAAVAEETSDEAVATAQAAVAQAQNAAEGAGAAIDVAGSAAAQAENATSEVAVLRNEFTSLFEGLRADLAQLARPGDGDEGLDDAPEGEQGPPAPRAKEKPAPKADPPKDEAPAEKPYGSGWWKW